MKVAGIDYSVHAVDVVLLNEDDDWADWHRITLDDRHGGFHAARDLRRWMPSRSWWENEGVYIVGMEDPFSNRVGTTKVHGYLAGAIGALLPPELDVVLTPPNEWMRILTGFASLPRAREKRKPLIRAASIDLNPAGKDWPQDGHDAYGIAYATRRLNQQAIERRRGAA